MLFATVVNVKMQKFVLMKVSLLTRICCCVLPSRADVLGGHAATEGDVQHQVRVLQRRTVNRAIAVMGTSSS